MMEKMRSVYLCVVCVHIACVCSSSRCVCSGSSRCVGVVSVSVCDAQVCAYIFCSNAVDIYVCSIFVAG